MKILTLMTYFYSVVAIFSLLFTVSSPAIASEEVDTIAFVKDVLDKSTNHFFNDISDSGAIGMNADWEAHKTTTWFIENQRSAADAIIAGLLWNNTQLIERGLLALEWGFKHQEADGSFNCPDSFHSTSFFVEAVSRSIRLIEASAYSQQYATRTEAMKPALLKAVKWMIQPSIKIKGDKNNLPYTHRRYLDAAALGEAGKLLGNKQLVDLSWGYIQQAIVLQQHDGVNPEKSGHDSSYQAVGVIYGIRYLESVATTKQSDELLPILKKAITWELSRIDAAGRININGNTRTGSSQETTRSGKVKEVNFREVAQAIAFWSTISNQPALLDIASKVISTAATFQ